MSHFTDFFKLYFVSLKIKGKRMTKITMLSLVTAAVLFTGCGEDTKKEATDSAAKAVESTKEAASHAVDATKNMADKAVEATKKTAKEAETSIEKAADKAVEATKEAAEATKEAAVKATDSAKKSVSTAVAGAVDSIVESAGKEAYAKCAGCHGADGKTKALGKSPVIAGLSKEDLVGLIKEYKAGTRNKYGMGNLMKGQVASMDDTTIEAVATYISKLK
jgi:cytochrome c553